MTQQQKINDPGNRITNKGCPGHYWTEVQNLDDMKATEHDIWWYNRYGNTGLRIYYGRLDL